jgi:spore coat polysaccharide biosynthesis protein SpsF|tara:strand:+ start:8989 stop:9708 length:720 start_codon:yes stop_codon:yes gene_type:complete
MILGIIQARMGSTRLPGKVMMEILNKPFLWHIYQRLKTCKNLENICIATSTDTSNDILEDFATYEKIPLFRGSESRLVDRLLGAAKKFNATAIVRITADCPLVDPILVDQLISVFNKHSSIDFVSNTLERTFPDGLDVEIISVNFLERLSKILLTDNQQEYFTDYIIKNSIKFNCKNIKNEINLANYRLTLDYDEDLKLISKIYDDLSCKSKIFTTNDILLLLKQNPNLLNINKMHVKY